jgi:hypothetical protein
LRWHTEATAIVSPTLFDLLSSGFIEAERRELGLPIISLEPPSKRQLNWVRKLHAYERFTHCHDRTPRENTRNRQALPAEERRMGEWARYQRRLGEELCNFQRARLDVSGAFEWDPQEAAWDAQLNECIRLAARSGRLPILSSADPVEFASARWLGRQLQQLQSGTLLPNRADRIRDLLNMFVGR